MAKSVTVFEEFQLTIHNMEAQFKSVLPKHIKSEKFENVVVTAVRTKPDLLKLNRPSLFNACMDCAQDGLLPNGVEAALVPFKGNVKYMPMVGGITKKARTNKAQGKQGKQNPKDTARAAGTRDCVLRKGEAKYLKYDYG